MEKMALSNRNLAFVGFFIVFSMVFMFLAGAVNILTSSGGTSFNVNESISHLYNISVDDTDSAVNITQVNVSLFNGAVFGTGTNGNKWLAAFINTSGNGAVLSWSNDTCGIANITTLGYFWFNLTAYTPGAYNISILTANSSGIYVSNVSVQVNDTTKPAIVKFVSPTMANGSYVNTSSITVNLSSSDNGVLGAAVIDLYNSSASLVNSTTSTSSFNYTYSFTGLSDGVYYLNATVNDSAGNSNSSATTSFTIDLTSPVNVTFVSPTLDSGINLSQTSIPVNVTFVESHIDKVVVDLYNSTGLVNSTSGTSTPFFINITGLSDGVYYLNATVNDSAGNSNSSATRIIVLDTTAPVITLVSPSDGTSSTASEYNFTFNSSSGVANLSSCSLMLDNVLTTSLNHVSSTAANGMNVGSLSAGSHGWSVNCTDASGNTGNSSTRTFTVASTVISSAGSNDLNYVSSNSYWTTTYSFTDKELSSYGTLSQNINTKERIKVELNGEEHSVGLVSISGSSATINISSTPQQVTLSVGESKKIEINGDNYYDLLVTFNSISNGRANLTLSYLHEIISVPLVKNPTQGAGETSPVDEGASTSVSSDGNQNSGQRNMFYIYIVILIVIIAVIVWLIVRANSSQKLNSRVKIKG